jgi:cytochrome c biogenesis protein CcdA
VLTTLPLAFLAGLLTILSPCVLPLAPIVIAGARSSGPAAPLALAAGLALTFGLVGGALASLGFELGGSDALRLISAALMIVIALVMLWPSAKLAAERALAPIARLAERWQGPQQRGGALGAFALGAVLALAWAPCAGPTLGAAFTLAASGGSLPAAVVTLAVFALGAAGALIVAGYALGRLAGASRARIGRAAAFGRYAFALVLALTGALVLTGLDHSVEAALVAASPDWLTEFATRL